MNIQEKLKEFDIEDEFVLELAEQVEGIMYDYESHAINVLELAKSKAEAESLEKKVKLEQFIDIAKLVAGLVA